MVDPHDFLKPIFATDREFGDDGNLYVSDFVGLNWDGRSVGGRLDTMRHSLADGPEVAEVKSLFAIGFTQRPSPELEKLLAHTDLRVRHPRGRTAHPAKMVRADCCQSQREGAPRTRDGNHRTPS